MMILVMYDSMMCMSCMDIDSTCQNGSTALHGSSQGGHASCMELLLSHGANVDIVDKVNHECML